MACHPTAARQAQTQQAESSGRHRELHLSDRGGRGEPAQQLGPFSLRGMRIDAGALIAAMLAATALALAPGAGMASEPSPDNRAMVSVAGEPDRDGDGFGDETEDGCPWNAAVQVECPPVRPEVRSVKPTWRAILVKVSVSSQARVQVFGAGAPRIVPPGTVAGFRVPLTKVVLRRLDRLTPQQGLRTQIRIRTTDLAGRENDRLVTVKLRGRGS